MSVSFTLFVCRSSGQFVSLQIELYPLKCIAHVTMIGRCIAFAYLIFLEISNFAILIGFLISQLSMGLVSIHCGCLFLTWGFIVAIVYLA